MCSCCYGSLSLVFTAITLLTTFLSAVAEGIFFFYSHRADNRFIKGIVGTYEQRVGLAFFLQMGAAFFHFLSFLVAMIATYFSFSGVKDAQDHYSLQRSSRTNQRVGLAFFLQMGAAFFHFLSFLVAMIATYFSFSGVKDAQDHYSLQRSSRTNVTNIGRSMEFDAPLMYQSQTPQPNIRPPYSKHEEYERHVAESMPELGMTRLGTPNKFSS
ncbi:Clc-like protein [Ancylostoma caninum]|uniref:Clc-like protein n=1 Tax=Ancylostoma caninum TaxID=29170 RepID=A0A368GY87_ANCCA|nr:Clc-like protein [Ancylostoma caninum]